MRIAMIGLGKMGANMARRLRRKGLEEDTSLASVAPYVADSGEGRWRRSPRVRPPR
jgi:6-phosphogluconate dehydrogenase (decarboxylating)